MSTLIRGNDESKNENKKNQGGNFMKKITNNKKGFSLIELLIVVAIMAVLAAISINLFGNVLNNSKSRADKSACSYLQTAIQTYIVETNDDDLGEIGGNVYATVTGNLAKTVSIDTDGDGKAESYGPYLNNGLPKLSSDSAGFNVVVTSSTQIVEVTVGTSDTIVINP